MGNPYAPPGEGSRSQRPAGPPGPESGQPVVGPLDPRADGPHPGAHDEHDQHHRPGADGDRRAHDPHDPHDPRRAGGPDGAGDRGTQGGPGRRRRSGVDPASPVARATSRRVLHFLALLLAGVLTSGLPLPWQAGSVLFVLAAIVVGIRALVLAWRGGIRGGLAVMLAVGVVVAGFVSLAMLSLLALWPQQAARQECLERAVTISADRACEAEFQRAVNERLGRGDAPTEG